MVEKASRYFLNQIKVNITNGKSYRYHVPVIWYDEKGVSNSLLSRNIK